MKFLVYKNGKRAESLDLTGAYLFDPERIPLSSSKNITFDDGIIYVGDPGTISAGLALPWDIEGVGSLMLPTTKLNIRQQPYLLNLELARARLMEITRKCEDWAVFDEDKSNTQKAIAKARSLYVEAMTCEDDPARASVLADKCLHMAVVASESLAQKQTGAVLTSKKKDGELNRYTLGCVYQREYADNDQYVKHMLDNFAYITVPVTWKDIEPRQGEYDYSSIDKALLKFKGKKVFLSVGPLIRFNEDCLPEWVFKYDFERVQEYVYGFISETVNKYAGKIHQWNLISSMNSDNCMNFGFDQCIEMTRTACVSAKATDTKSLKMVEIDCPWSCYHIDKPFTISAVMYADLLVSNAIIFDCMGINMSFGKGGGDMFVRDLMQISAMLDRICVTSRPVHISGVSSPAAGNGDSGGYWRNPWSESSQAAWLEALYRIFLGKNQIGTVTYSTLADVEGSESCDGLYNSSLEPKAAAKTIRKFSKFILHK
ncbi:MAG: endo-1,4-beta-xylanase [Sedimentisphaeraceae bacterium JB056]